jgi:hypothetical protein
MDDERLISVVHELRRLQKLVDDLEWEGEDVSAYKRELEHYTKLNEDGVLFEPKF